MKRLVMVAFLFGWLGVGCMMGQPLGPPEGPPTPKTAVRPSPPPVTPEQVDPNNPREALKRLEDELNDVPARQGIQPTPPYALPNGPDRK